MNHTKTLTISSVLSVIFITLHLAADILFKMSPPGLVNLVAVIVLVTWLYGALELPERRTGYVIVLLDSLIGLLIPIVHMRGSLGVLGGAIPTPSERFFFVWTLLALATTSAFSAVLSVRALWKLPWRRVG